MKRPLTLALCIALSSALLPGSACEATEPTALTACPAKHVATVKEHLGLMREMNRILAAGMGEDETLAALEALRPRMEAVSTRVRQMSSHRYLKLLRALEPNFWQALPALSAATSCDICLGDQPSPVAVLATELMNTPGRVPTDATPADTAAALLRQAEELEATLKQPGLHPAEQAEALHLHEDKLLFIDSRLYPGMAEGYAFARELERCLAETPGAVQRLQEHLEFIRRQREAAGLPDTPLDYEDKLSSILLHRLPELMPEGRAALAEVAAFLRASAQEAVYYGSLSVGYEAPNYPLMLYRMDARFAPEGAGAKLPACRSITFIVQGTEEEQKAFADTLLYAPACLLRCKPEALRVSAEGDGELAHPIPRSDILMLPGGWGPVLRLLEKEPGLRQRLQDPDTP